MNKVSKTEDILYDAMLSIGLSPKRQFLVKRYTDKEGIEREMKVDFAFPDKKLVIEVDGAYKRNAEGMKKLFNRRRVCESEGWRVENYTAEEIYENPEKYAWRIAYILKGMKIVKAPEKIVPKSQTKLPQVEEQKLIPKETPKAETREDEEDSSYESSDIYPYGNNPVLQLTAKDLKNIRKEKWKIWEEEQKEKQKKKLKEKPKIKTYNPKHKELGFKEVIEIIFWIIMATLLIKAVLLFGS